MLFIFMMTYKCHVTKMSGAIQFKKESIETLKIYHKTATYTACKKRRLLPYFCLSPTVQRNTPPNATSSPNTTATHA